MKIIPCLLLLASAHGAEKGPLRNLSLGVITGDASARNGDHGGFLVGLQADFPFKAGILGLSAEAIGELDFSGNDEVVPNEGYGHFGVSWGYGFDLGRAFARAGLGAGYLNGERRTSLLAVEEGCRRTSFFQDECKPQDVYQVRRFDTARFGTFSLDPHIETGYRIHEAFILGVRAQAYMNGEQGLWSLALFCRIGG